MEKYTVAESEHSNFYCVLDAGLKKSIQKMSNLGWMSLLPNMDYLFESKDRVRVNSDPCHADAISPPYLWRKRIQPKLTVSWLENSLSANSQRQCEIRLTSMCRGNSEIDFGDAVVSFLQTTHSIPEVSGCD